MNVEKPPSIGEVELFDIMKGVVSDNTCNVNPCDNGGSCQVTWNDFYCACMPGFKGRKCDELEYCYWYTCPNNSECRTLIDGHECVSNATFNGLNSTVVYNPDFKTSANFTTPDKNSIDVTFRTKMNGTLIHVHGNNEETHFRVSVYRGELAIDVPELGRMKTFSFGSDVNNGEWHTLKISFDESGSVSASMDGSAATDLTQESTLNLTNLLSDSNIIVGSFLSTAPSPTLSRDYYASDTNGLPEDVEIHSEESFEASQRTGYSLVDFYRGCIGEVRIGGILLPFFTEQELVNSTASEKFVVRNMVDVTDECTVCYQNECQNGGQCSDPADVFECTCPQGFEDPFCSTNIDECENNSCINGQCVDGIANYTCNCQNGWTGWK